MLCWTRFHCHAKTCKSFCAQHFAPNVQKKQSKRSRAEGPSKKRLHNWSTPLGQCPTVPIICSPTFNFESILVANPCHDCCSRFSATALTPTYRREIIQGCWWHVRWMIHEFQFGAHQNGLQDWGIIRWEQQHWWYASVQRARLMTMLPPLHVVH